MLGALSADILRALEAVRIPAYIVDTHRRVRWQNQASREFAGDVRGRLDSGVGLDPKDLAAVREAWIRKLNGKAHEEIEMQAPRADGTRVKTRVSTVPLRNDAGEIIGAFGMVTVLGQVDAPVQTAPRLSPREHQTLQLLAAGYSTTQMAEEMGIATETVRNHVKRLLRTLGACSRVAAVAEARRVGVI